MSLWPTNKAVSVIAHNFLETGKLHVHGDLGHCCGNVHSILGSRNKSGLRNVHSSSSSIPAQCMRRSGEYWSSRVNACSAEKISCMAIWNGSSNGKLHSIQGFDQAC